MNDMQPIPELTDQKLAELAATSKRQSAEVEIAKVKVRDIEASLAEAKAAHDKAFPRGGPLHHATAEAERSSMAAIDRLQQDDLHWSKRRVAQLETAAAAADEKTATAANPAAMRLFEVALADGRKTKHPALDAASLQARLTNGAKVTADLSGRRDAPGRPVATNFFNGFIAAFGPELLKWLSEQGVVIRRGDT